MNMQPLSPALPGHCSLPLLPLSIIPSRLQTNWRAPQSPSPTTHIHPLHQPNPLKAPSWTLHSPSPPVKPPPELTICSRCRLGVFSASGDLLALNQSELPWEQRGCSSSFIFLQPEVFFFFFQTTASLSREALMAYIWRSVLIFYLSWRGCSPVQQQRSVAALEVSVLVRKDKVSKQLTLIDYNVISLCIHKC